MNTAIYGYQRLRRLPRTIWAQGRPLPYVYRGTPSDMVRQMAEEMGEDMESDEAIEVLVDALAENRGVLLQLPKVEGPLLAAVFISALLATGVAKTVPAA